MKETNLRKLHRHLGAILAVFIIIQVGGGLYLSLAQLSIPHTHEHGTPDTDEGPSAVSKVAMTIHHGGGLPGTIYRVLLAVGILVQTMLGTMIFLRIRSRKRK